MKKPSLLSTGVFVALSFMAPSPSHAGSSELPFGQLAPFTTDGCTGFAEGASQLDPHLWRHCCFAHDLRYWRGGSSEEREAADQELASCVSETGHPIVAEIMYAGVRVGGNPWSETSWRWGYGWEIVRGYSALTPAEEALANSIAPTDLSKVEVVPLLNRN